MKTPDGNGVARTVVSAIAEAEDVPPEALPPSGMVVDVEALESFLASSHGEARAGFRYRGRKIGVAADGRVAVSEPAGDDGPFVSRCDTSSAERRGSTSTPPGPSSPTTRTGATPWRSFAAREKRPTSGRRPERPGLGESGEPTDGEAR